MNAITIACSVLYFVSMMCNALGLYLLTVVRPLTNSKFLLTNLAFSEIFLSAVHIGEYFVRAYLSAQAILIIDKVLTTIWLIQYSAMLSLSIDRFIAIKYPLKYRIMVTKKRLKLAVSAAWLSMITFGASFSYATWFVLFGTYFWIIVDFIFLIISVVTYAFIFIKILQSRRFGNNNQSRTDSRRQRFVMNREIKFFKIVGWLVSSFILLFFIPDTIMLVTKSGFDPTMAVFTGIAWPMGFIADPIIYVFMQDDLRSLFKKRILKMKSNEQLSRQDTTQDTSL